MELLSLRCQHCGAPLRVDADTRFVTCQFCRTELAVKHGDNAVFTEVLGRLEQTAAQISGDVAALRLEHELARLDRDWETRRALFLIPKEHGPPVEPSRGTGITVIIIGVLLGIAVGAQAFATGHVALCGLAILPLIAGVFIGRRLMRIAAIYDEMHAAYRKRRAELMQQVRTLES